MEEEISHLRSLLEEHELGILRASKAAENGESVDAVKLDLIRIEGSIEYSSQKLLSLIYKDDRIPSEKREEQLQKILSEIGIDIDQMRVRRRSTINAANEALLRVKSDVEKKKREKLLGDSANEEIIRTVDTKNRNTQALASDITERLERTRQIISEQILASEQSLLLMEQSTEELHGVNDAAQKAGIAQSKAQRHIIQLKIAQNWDRYLFKASLYIFAFCVCLVLYRRITRNVVTTVITKMISWVYRIITFITGKIIKSSDSYNTINGNKTNLNDDI